MDKKNNKKQTRKKNKRFQEQTTFDPKLHYQGKGQSGYGLRRDMESKNNNSGSQLAHLFDRSNNPTKKI